MSGTQMVVYLGQEVSNVCMVIMVCSVCVSESYSPVYLLSCFYC